MRMPLVIEVCFFIEHTITDVIEDLNWLLAELVASSFLRFHRRNVFFNVFFLIYSLLIRYSLIHITFEPILRMFTPGWNVDFYRRSEKY